MLVFVLDHNKKPLMPCSPAKARHLLEDGKAKCVRRTPFTIKLLFGSSGYKQEVVAGIDTGSKVIGSAAVANGKVVYQSEITIRNDIKSKMDQRRMYRQHRRHRNLRYRPPRFNNRSTSKCKNRFAPSIISKTDSHLREKRQIESILPVSKWIVELASFDINKITNPDVCGVGYQNGPQKGYYNVKAYVLSRDAYKCQSGRKCNCKKLHVHHVQFRSMGGPDAPWNLITLCEECHDALHRGEFSYQAKKSKTKHASEIGFIKSQIKKSTWDFIETFGYETKYKRESCLNWPKSHANDAVAICLADGETVEPSDTLYVKRHVSKGDYKQTRGSRSEQKMPTGKTVWLP